jgi:hypothetical protein
MYRNSGWNFGQSHVWNGEEGRWPSCKPVGIECSKNGPFQGHKWEMFRWVDASDEHSLS